MKNAKKAAEAPVTTISPIAFHERTGISRRMVDALLENGTIKHSVVERPVRNRTLIPESEVARILALLKSGGLKSLRPAKGGAK